MTTPKQTVTVVDLAFATSALHLKPSRLRVVTSFSGLRALAIRDLLLILDIAQIQKIGAYFDKHASTGRHLRAVLLQGAGKHLALLPQLLAPLKHKQLLKILIPTSEPGIMERILFAWGINAQNTLIADAQVVGDRLVVLSCALEKIEIPFAATPVLSEIPERDRTDFRINDQGSFIHWPDRDLHLDLDSLRQMANPEAAAKLKAQTLKYDREYGQAIAQVRKNHGLKQSDITGLTDRHVRRIESGEMRPTAKALKSLACAHGMSVNAYLDVVAESAPD